MICINVQIWLAPDFQIQWSGGISWQKYSCWNCPICCKSDIAVLRTCQSGIIFVKLFPLDWSCKVPGSLCLMKLHIGTMLLSSNKTELRREPCPSGHGSILVFRWVQVRIMTSVTRKKSPNVYKTCPKIILLENDRFWHLYKNSLGMWEIWAN